MSAADMQIFRQGVFTTSGWGRAEYSGWIDESQSRKTSCYIGDWSFLDQCLVRGPDALRLFSDFAVNSFARFAIRQAMHIICCNGDGKVIGEGVLMRLAEHDFEFQALGDVTAWTEYKPLRGGYRAEAIIGVSRFKYKVSRPKALYALEQGPKSETHAAPGTGATVAWAYPGTRQKAIRAVVAPSPYKANPVVIEVFRGDVSSQHIRKPTRRYWRVLDSLILKLTDETLIFIHDRRSVFGHFQYAPFPWFFCFVLSVDRIASKILRSSTDAGLRSIARWTCT